MHRKGIGSDGPERLAQIAFFSSFSPAQRQMLARLIDELEADPGEALMEEGSYGYEAIFIEEGTAEVRQHGQAVGSVGPGEVVGELALVHQDGRRTATIVATSPLRALSLTSHAVHGARERMPDLAEAIDRAAAEHDQKDAIRERGAAG